MQEVGSRAVDPKALTGEDALTKRQKAQRGEMVLGIRQDAVPTNEANKLAAEGGFYPLTLDAKGFLRVTLPEGTEVESAELEVQRENNILLSEIRDLLMKIA